MSDGWPLLLNAAALSVFLSIVAWRRGWLAAPTSPSPAPRRAPWLVALFFGMLFAHTAGVIGARALLGAGDATGDLRTTAIASAAGYLAQIPVAIAVLRLLPAPDPSRGRAILAGALGIAIILPFVATASTAGAIVESLVRAAPPPALGHDTLRLLVEASAGGWRWLIVAGVLMGAPILEEIAYRGALQGAFRAGGMATGTAMLATSVLFVVMHVPAIPEGSRASALGGLLVLSLGLGLLRERTGGLVAPIVAHVAFNGANLLLAGAFVRA
jgi:membrane protease YdiL (CAAX protease family)